MEDMIIYVPTRIIKIGNQCRLIPIQAPGCLKKGNDYQTVDKINPDLVYSRSKFPSNIFKGSYMYFYDKCIELGHTDQEAKALINRYMTFSPYKPLPQPPLYQESFQDFYETSDDLMDEAFRDYNPI